MEFDMSKENIQPLRGGRNRAQLEVALQAQADTELQKELMLQRHEYETAIKTYDGDDPLDNWYSYISWLEQSYPKHGHEGNLFTVLEDCLGKFENDVRYIHDRRMCKLWIKYIDLQQNPDELFQLLHSKGICVSCADLYRAWAFYHEIAGCYKRANSIYQLGLRALAQPMDELEQAHKNMFFAAGRQTVQEMDEQAQQQMEEKRQALTSLRSYKHKKVVPSTRVGLQVLKSTPGRVTASSSASQSNKSNAVVQVYSDENQRAPGAVAGAAATSVLEIARRKCHVKENTLKPGTWTKLKPKKTVPVQHLQPAFKVHEDDLPTAPINTINLYPNFCPTNLDDFSNWRVPLCVPEPDDPKKISMYPKNLFYVANTEYSMEEIKSRKYLTNKTNLPTNNITNEDKNNFLICEDKPVKESTGPFTIFTDEEETNVKTTSVIPNDFSIYEDCTENQSDNNSNELETKINNFSIYQDCTDNPQPETIKLNNFSIYEDEASNSKHINLPGPSKQPDIQNKASTSFTIYADEKNEKLTPFPRILKGQSGSKSQKDESNILSLPKDGFVLGRSKSDKSEVKIKEHIRSLISMKPTQECGSQIIKLDKSSFNS